MAKTPSRFVRTLALLPMLAAAGCASVPDLGPRPSLRDTQSVAAGRSLTTVADEAWPSADPWSAYGDPQLRALIEEGLRNSPDVAAAAARIRRAGGLAQEAGAARYPTLDVQGAATLDQQSSNNGIPAQFIPNGWRGRGELAASSGFDLDLWGRNRAALAAATSEREAAELDAAQARLLLGAAIASAYFDLSAAFAEEDVRQRALDVRLASRDLLARRLASGLENQGSVRQSEAEVASARAALALARQELGLRRNQLAALVGQGPDRGLDLARPDLPAPAPRLLPTGVTTDLIGRRPDIVAARVRTEAAAQRIAVARADFYPAIRLSALIGVQSLGLLNLADAGSNFGSIGPAVSLPIFRGGALQGRYRVARAGFDETVADYDRAVVEAYRQVADAVTTGRSAALRLADARAAVAATADAYRVAQDRYRAGLSNYLDVLAVEDRALAAQIAQAGAEAALRRADVALLRALGGGFSDEGRSAVTKDPPDA